ncbi:MAG: DUF2723 domain-containing protein [Bdellovibrionales bacterium]|nr:DUF2723 domain-containing protein [Bdellovibrionales bacterium]
MWLIAPGLHWLDSSELALGSHVLAITHPPGQVPYLFFAKAFQMFPIGSIAFRTNLFSWFSTLVGGFVFLQFCQRQRLSYGAIAVITIILSGFVFKQAVRTEVYSLAATLGLITIVTTSLNDVRAHYLGAFCAGLLVAAHPIIGLVVLPSLIKRKWAPMCLFFIMGTIVLVFLPIRGAGQSAWNFANIGSMYEFYWYITGKLYPAYSQTSLLSMLEHLRDCLWVIFKEHYYVLCILFFMGMFLWFRQKSKIFVLKLGLGLGALILALVRQNNFWANNPDVYGYLSLLSWVVGLMCVFATDSIGNSGVKYGRTIAVMIWSVCIFHILLNQKELLRYRRDNIAMGHMNYLMLEPFSRGKVFVSSFVTLSLMTYGREVEKRRPDIKLAYRGDSKTNARQPVSHATSSLFELAISKGQDQKYALKVTDYEMLDDHFSCKGWFCDQHRFSLEKRSIFNTYLNDATQRMSQVEYYASEPYVLHALLTMLAFRYQRDFENESKEKSLLLFLLRETPDYNTIQ